MRDFFCENVNNNKKMLYLCMSNTQKNGKMNTNHTQNVENQQFTLKTGSRIDNASGYLITSKNYRAMIIGECRFNFVVIKIGTKTFKTDRSNLI